MQNRKGGSEFQDIVENPGQVVFQVSLEEVEMREHVVGSFTSNLWA